jgi:hypothetical protein
MVLVPRATGVAVDEVMPFPGFDAVVALANVEALETMHLAEAIKRQERCGTSHGRGGGTSAR